MVKTGVHLAELHLAEVHLAELLGGLSLACDLADGFPPEKVMRGALLAVEIGRRHGLSAEALRDVYYVAMLRYLGCTAFAHEEAHVYGAGDDINTRNVMATADVGDKLGLVAHVAKGIGREGPPLGRARAVARLLSDPQAVTKHAHSQCETSVRFAALVGVSPGVRAALTQICERYDGRGAPNGTAGEALSLVMRVVHVADVAEIEHHRHGRKAACAVIRRRSGRHFDPRVTQTFLGAADELLSKLEGPSVWEAFLEAEPHPRVVATASRLDDVALAFAQFSDLKSVYTLGHSTGVADLAARAAEVMGLDENERRLLRRAALLHDVGRVSVANGIWDKRGSLSPAEWERVRLHAYYTERVLWRSPALRDVAQLAAAAHERLDGTGYHRAIPAAMLARPARLLAACDVYRALREPRPHRAAFSALEAERMLRADVASGHLDPRATSAVLEAAGLAPSRIANTWPSGLTDREVEVLRLLARGCSNKEIGALLDISARTAQHHVAHIYAKIDVNSRASAALFATEKGLLDT